MQFTWTIDQLERDQQGGVRLIHWRLKGTDVDGLSEEIYGTLSVKPDPDNPAFIPFEDLTQDLVISWVRDRLPGMEDKLRLSIERKKNATTIQGLPW